MACRVAAVGLGTQAVLAPALGCAIFLLQHVGHQIGHGPHAFANLRTTSQTGLQTDGHVGSLISA